jgi:hypothetical protein
MRNIYEVLPNSYEIAFYMENKVIPMAKLIKCKNPGRSRGFEGKSFT